MDGDEGSGAAAELADSLLAVGDLIGARDVLVAALLAGLSHPGISHNLGNVLSRMGLWDEAVEAYSRAIDAGYPSYLARGLAFEQLHNLDSAAHDYEALLLEDPLDISALVNLGTLETARGDLDRARTLLTRAVTMDPTVNWQLAEVATESGDDETALAQLALAIAAGEPRAHLDRALLLAAESRREVVIAEFEMAVEAGASGARREFAIYLDRNDEPRRALQITQEGIEAGERECYATAAIIAESLGERSLAIELYRNAIAVGDVDYRVDLERLLAED